MFNFVIGTWESYIWKMKRREEDYELVPQKHYIGAHKSKWLAFRACEKASIERGYLLVY
jgi:hypothetical protein